MTDNILKKRKKIDAHAHIVPLVNEDGPVKLLKNGDGILPSGDKFRVMPESLMASMFKHTELLSFMDEWNIESAILLQGYIYGYLNDEIYEVIRNDNRFIPAMLVDFNSDDCIAKIEYYHKKYGFAIIKILSDGSLPQTILDFDSARFERIWSCIKELRLSVVIDTGPVNGPYPAQSLDRLTSKLKENHFIIAHAGFPEKRVFEENKLYDQWRKMIELGKRDNVWFDLSAFPYLLREYDNFMPKAWEIIQMISASIGCDKLLWGSDIPGNWNYASSADIIAVAEDYPDFTDDEKNLIFYSNAKRAFGI